MRSKIGPTLSLLAAALLAGAALAGPFSVDGADGWSTDEVSVLSSMRLSELPPTPKDASNAYEASPAAASLGQRIFFDRRFSGNGAVSCASCHQPDKQFQDGRPLGLGIGTGARRTMPVVAAGQMATLADVVRHYSKAPPAAAGHSELRPVELSEAEAQDLIAFLGTLSGAVVEAPEPK